MQNMHVRMQEGGSVFPHCHTIVLLHSPTLVSGSQWRINFSRVESRGEVNWVWAPQRVWDPEVARYQGKVWDLGSTRVGS